MKTLEHYMGLSYPITLIEDHGVGWFTMRMWNDFIAATMDPRGRDRRFARRHRRYLRWNAIGHRRGHPWPAR